MTDPTPTTGVIDPITGRPHPNSGPSGGPIGTAAGTQARDVATRGTAGTEDGPDAPSGAKDHIDDAAGTAQDKAQQAADAAKAKAQEAAGQAQAKAQDAAGQAKSQVAQQLDQRSTQAGERATATAGDLRSISDHLRDQGNDAPAKLADNAALQIEKVGSYLQRTDGSSLLQDAQGFARRNPWPTALAGLALGFAAARTLKASTGGPTGTSSSPSPAPARTPTGTGTPPVAALPPVTPSPVTPSPAAAVPDATGAPAVTGYSVPSGAPGQPGTATFPAGS
jgi:hypothetical protein